MSSPSVDPSWSLSLPDDPAYTSLTDQWLSIRHDPRFSRQLYYASFVPTQPNRVLVNVAQAVASENGKSVSLNTFLKKLVPVSDNSYTGVCIDEVAGKLYLYFRGTQEDKADCKWMPLPVQPGQKCFHLAVVDLAFGEPDALGYRSVTRGPYTMYRLNFYNIVPQKLCLFLLPSEPNAGALLYQVRYSLPFMGQKVVEGIGIVDFDALEGKRIDTRLLVSSDNPVTSTGLAVLGKGQHLAVFNRSALSARVTDKRLSVVYVYSITEDLGQSVELETKYELNYDEVILMTKLYPPASLWSHDENMKRMSFAKLWLHNSGSGHAGRVFKYSIFIGWPGVAMVKRLDQWQPVVKRTPANELAPTTNTRLLLVKFDSALFQAAQGENASVCDLFIVGSAMYYKPVFIDRPCSVHRIELGHYLKDYRTCAQCGDKETRKRRNEKGERVARFKVCRDCKKLKLHKTWWKNACHFCSEKCMKEGWKKHKESVHNHTKGVKKTKAA